MTQESLLALADDAYDMDVVDVLTNEKCEDTWANREIAGAIALLAGAFLDGKNPAGLNTMIANQLGMQVAHHQPHQARWTA